ncbi:hypothetical protein C9374_009614 [Naegleria lovaniensis]|uniref:Transmembrane protein n=1 Tax=Naegleria lovaniensis TaxID=51637 RepID=A0AA88KR95_NAELO|nr:uncharacterized protein C9374_009614 [Naegleria lovaniensis]KAG2393037.1 hypothetical protein C9374_009614 [Naegleria lovaniensis]
MDAKQPLYTGQAQFVQQPPSQQYPPQGYYVDPNQQVVTYQQTTTVAAAREPNEEDANTAMIMFVIGFFFGLLWIVNFAMYRNSPNYRAQQFAKYSLYAFIISLIFAVVLIVFSIVLPIIVTAAAVSTH